MTKIISPHQCNAVHCTRKQLYWMREIPEQDQGPAFSPANPKHVGQNCMANDHSAHHKLGTEQLEL